MTFVLGGLSSYDVPGLVFAPVLLFDLPARLLALEAEIPSSEQL